MFSAPQVSRILQATTYVPDLRFPNQTEPSRFQITAAFGYPTQSEKGRPFPFLLSCRNECRPAELGHSFRRRERCCSTAHTRLLGDAPSSPPEPVHGPLISTWSGCFDQGRYLMPVTSHCRFSCQKERNKFRIRDAQMCMGQRICICFFLHLMQNDVTFT